jgi:hypothetical protein
MTTIWTIKIDWQRDGNFTEAIDDVPNYVKSAEWFLGMTEPYQDDANDSTLQLVLDNSDKRFSPENGASPLAGKVAPLRPVRVQSNDGTMLRTHWVGWLEEVTPSINQYGEQIATLTAAGVMLFMKEVETNIAIQENQRTDAIIAKLLQQVVIPPGLAQSWVLGLEGYGELGQATILPDTTLFSTLDAGVVTLALAADNWVQRGTNQGDKQDTFNVYRAIAEVTAAERGRFFFDRQGRAVFWNRVRLQDDLPSAVTLDNSMTDLEYAYGSMADFRNEVAVEAPPRMVGESPDEVLWELDTASAAKDQPLNAPPGVRVDPGKTQTIHVKYQDSDNGNARIGAKDVRLTDVQSEGSNTTITLDASANSATITLLNQSTQPFILRAAKVRGRKVTDYGRMEAQARQMTSIAKYGRRSMRMNLTAVESFEYAQYIADFEAKRRGASPRGMVRRVVLRSHAQRGGDHHAHQVARTLGDVVTVSEAQTAHTSRRYVIIGESHRLTHGATLLETTWYLEAAAASPFPWKLGVAGRSELGSVTALAF